MADTARTVPRMQRIARWHVWLGWLVGVPILMWTVTGLFMVARPIDEVRGAHLRHDRPAAPLLLAEIVPPAIPSLGAKPVKDIRTAMQRGVAVTTETYLDGTTARFNARTGEALGLVTADQARRIAEHELRATSPITSVRLFPADEAPVDFRKPVPAWRVAFADGTYVYIGQESAEIEAVRTRWWRIFDVMWGLHIMDLKTREDTSHPVLILFAALSAVGALLGCIAMFRRRKPRAAS